MRKRYCGRAERTLQVLSRTKLRGMRRTLCHAFKWLAPRDDSALEHRTAGLTTRGQEHSGALRGTALARQYDVRNADVDGRGGRIRRAAAAARTEYFAAQKCETPESEFARIWVRLVCAYLPSDSQDTYLCVAWCADVSALAKRYRGRFCRSSGPVGGTCAGIVGGGHEPTSPRMAIAAATHQHWNIGIASQVWTLAVVNLRVFL